MWNVDDKRYDADTKCAVVWVHHVAARSTCARAQDGSSEADTMTVRMRARVRFRVAAARVTPGGRRGARTARRRAPHEIWPSSLPHPLIT